MKIDVTILVPLAGNDGVPFERGVFKQLEDRAIALFGGFQQQHGVVRGAWVDGGVVYPDDLVAYVVAVPGLLASGGRVLELAAAVKVDFAQLAVYVR